MSATINYKPADHVTVTSVSGYYQLKQALQGNFAFGDQSYIAQSNKISIKQFSQEIRALTSFDFPLNVMIGGYYQNVDNTTWNLFGIDNPLSKVFSGSFFNGPILAANNIETQKTSAYSVFGQAIIDIGKKLQVTAGGRFSHERKSASGTSMPNTFNGGTLAVPFTPGTRSFQNFSPEITATYKPIRNLTLYAAYREGFVSGGYDLNPATIAFGKTAIGDVSFNQETARGAEVGVKGTLADRQIIFDFDAYRFKYSGLQVSAFDPATVGYRITNAGSAIVKGVEVAGQFRPNGIRGLTFRTAVAYNDASYESFPNAPCYTGQTPVGGCKFIASRDASGALSVVAAAPGQTANAQDLSGRPLTRSSEWTGNLGATFDVPLNNDFVFNTSVDETYASPYFAGPDQDPRSRQRATWRLNAAVSVRTANDRWSVALIGTNLTQVLRATTTYSLIGTGGRTGTSTGFLGDLVGTPTEPRTITLQVTVKY